MAREANQLTARRLLGTEYGTASTVRLLVVLDRFSYRRTTHCPKLPSRKRPRVVSTIILDFAMPEVDGLRAANEISKLLPRVQIVLDTMYVARWFWRLINTESSE